MWTRRDDAYSSTPIRPDSGGTSNKSPIGWELTLCQYVDTLWHSSKNMWELVTARTSEAEVQSKNPAAFDLGAMIADGRLIGVEVSTTETLPGNDVSYTFDVGTRHGNNEPIIVLRRDLGAQFEWFGRNAWTNGQFDQRGMSDPMTWGIAIAHEFGHAWGNLKGRRIAKNQTWQEALNYENTARILKCGADTALRRRHR
jgi:hypothetical protein